MRHLLTTCVQARARDIERMVNESIEITYQTMKKHCDLSMWDKEHAPHISRDHGVSFYRSRYQGYRCYYLVHSAIEYIYM